MTGATSGAPEFTKFQSMLS